MSRKGRITNALFTLLLTFSLLAVSTGTTLAKKDDPPKADPRLLQMAEENPDAIFMVIVQKEAKNKDLKEMELEDEVLKGGGQVKKQLDLIVSFSAELTGKELTKLARHPKVRWISADAPMVSTAAGDPTVRDEFATASYSNNHGTQSWSSDWIEVDGAGAGPTSGNVLITGGELSLDDNPDTSGQPSLAREANLSSATLATLSFSFRTTGGVDSNDSAVVEISANGGASYTELEDFTGISGATSGTRSYNISAFASNNTRIRFRINNLYGGSSETFLVDNVQIEYVLQSSAPLPTDPPATGDPTVRDEFASASYGNNDGTQSWSSNWIELDGAGAGPTSGNVLITGGELSLDDNPDTSGQPSLAREASLSGAMSATLSFSFRTTSGVDTDDSVVVEISSNGGTSYTLLENFTGIAGTTTGTRSYNIAAYASDSTRIRFRVNNLYGGSSESFLVDNVQIEYSLAPTAPPPAGAGSSSIDLGLVGHYKLDEGAGTTAIDSSGLGHDGTHAGGPTYTTGVQGQSALGLLGANDMTTVADPVDGSLDFGTGDFAISLWFRTSANYGAGHWSSLVDKRVYSPSIVGYEMIITGDDNDKLEFQIWSGSTYRKVSSLNSVIDGQWHHAVGIRSGTTLSLYLDGVLQGTNNYGSLGSISNSDSLSFGNTTWVPTSNNYDGYLDNIRIYNRALSPAEVAQLGNFGIPVITSASLNKCGLTVTGYVDSAANQSTFANSRVEIFKSSADSGDYGEGQTFLGYTTTDSNGNFTYNGSLTASNLGAGDRLTATATDPNGNTSEFGPNYQLTAVSGTCAISRYVDSTVANQLNLIGSGVTVAVIDSGITTKHPDLMSGSNSRVIASTKFGLNLTTEDIYGHGTHVAGIIAGNGTSSQGLYRGMAPDASLVNIKVSDAFGMTHESDMVDGLQWIYNNKDNYNIRVVNISMNSTVAQSYHTSPLDAAVEILWFNGIVVVVSAGNNGTGSGPVTLYPPANDPFVITVGATEEFGTTAIGDDALAVFSAYGTTESGFAKPDLVAPGRNIIAPLGGLLNTVFQQHPLHRVNNYYFRMSGTSMSAPVVSGAVALLLQDEPGLNPDQVKYRLMATANQNWSYSADQAGAGYLDVYTAVTTSTNGYANQGIMPSQMLATGEDAIDFASVGWNSVGWNSVGWNSVGWNSVGWNSVGWNSVGWNSVGWNSVGWNSLTWDD